MSAINLYDSARITDHFNAHSDFNYHRFANLPQIVSHVGERHTVICDAPFTTYHRHFNRKGFYYLQIARKALARLRRSDVRRHALSGLITRLLQWGKVLCSQRLMKKYSEIIQFTHAFYSTLSFFLS